MQARAFNLLEVAVASAIAGIIAAAAVSSFAVLNRQLVRLQAESGASDDAKTLIDFLVTDLQAVGGGNVRPWMALWVEDSGTATAARDAAFGQTSRTTDRLNYALVVPDTRSCPVLSMTGTTSGDLFTSGNGASCCFQLLQDLDHAGFFEPGPTDLNFHVVVVNGAASRQVSLDTLSLAPVGPGTCSMKWKAGPLAGIDNVDGDRLIDSIDSSITPVTNFAGGSLSAVTIRTIYLDETTHDLFAFEEKRGINGINVVVDPDERKRVASNVFDLQLQLGFDGNPADGRLVDTSSTTDEWLYNASSDNLPTAIDPSDLRMSAVGVVVGTNVKDANYKSGAQVRGGPLRELPKFHMRGAMGKAALRNVFVFF